MKPSTVLFRLLQVLVILFLATMAIRDTLPAIAEPLGTDPVDELVRLMQMPPSRNQANPQEVQTAIQAHQARIGEAANKIKTTGDLVRALLLREMAGLPEDAQMQMVNRLEKNLAAALASENPLLQTAAAGQIADLCLQSKGNQHPRSIPFRKRLASQVPALAKHLQDTKKDSLVRQICARALGELPSDAAIWKAMGDCLEGKNDPAVAEAVATALGQILTQRLELQLFVQQRFPGQGEEGPEPTLDQSCPLIIACGKGLGHESGTVCRASLQNLRLTAKLLMQHVSRLDDPNHLLDKAALDKNAERLITIRKTNDSLRDLVSTVNSLLEKGDAPTRLACLEALESIGDLWVQLRRTEAELASARGQKPTKEDKADTPRLSLKETRKNLLANLEEKDLRIRLAAFYVLETLEDEAEPALPKMIKALKDENLFIRWAAARVLERIAPLGSEQGVPTLANALNDEDADVRASVLLALKRYGPKAKAAIKTLGEVVETSDLETRLQAIQVLLAIGTDAREAAPAFIKALAAPEQAVRLSAVQALGRLGCTDKETKEALRKALLDKDVEVRRTASAVLLSQTWKE